MAMHDEFTVIIEREDEWFIAYSPEIPGANGQGKTSEEACANLGKAIALILEDRREDALRSVPETAWSKEIERRVLEIHGGAVELVDWQEVRAELFADE